MQKIAYRMGEYKITQNEHGDLLWETHIGLGSLKIGKCFINGDVLFIKPSDSIGPGFLKGEFLDHLNKLPKWEKTKYYCASYKIYECQSVRREPLSILVHLSVSFPISFRSSVRCSVVRPSHRFRYM